MLSSFIKPYIVGYKAQHGTHTCLIINLRSFICTYEYRIFFVSFFGERIFSHLVWEWPLWENLLTADFTVNRFFFLVWRICVRASLLFIGTPLQFWRIQSAFYNFYSVRRCTCVVQFSSGKLLIFIFYLSEMLQGVSAYKSSNHYLQFKAISKHYMVFIGTVFWVYCFAEKRYLIVIRYILSFWKFQFGE